MWALIGEGSNFQLEGLKIEFLGLFKWKEQFDPNFC